MEKLAAAAAQLRGAAGTLDQGRLQIQEATALIEQAVKEMSDAAQPFGARHPAWLAATQLQQTAVMLDDVAQAFAHIPDMVATPCVAIGAP